MKLPELGVKRPTTTIMLFLLILLFGAVSYTQLKVDVLPDMEMPMLTVMTIYPGASASEVEEQVSKKIEEKLSSISNLKSIKSKSKENVSFVSLEFNWNTDLTEATNDTRDKIELVKRSLPDDAENPIIIKINSAMMPVLMYSIEADKSFNALNRIVNDDIINSLKKVKGVGSVMIFGQPEREIKIEVNPFKLKAYNLNIGTIASVLKATNVSIPGGNIKVGDKDLAIRIPGEFTSIEDIKNSVIYSVGNLIVRIKDVAEVVDGFKEKDELIYSSSKKCVELMVQKQSGANTLEVAELIKEKMEEITKKLPSDVRINLSNDASELVFHSIENLKSTIGWAALFVIMVVLFFLRDFKSSVIIILTIPFSLIGAFAVMYFMGYSINIFSLMALVIAIGMVVDNAIVVLENIIKHTEKGVKPREASIFGTSEMGMAISASTLTTISVFLPMAMMGGLVGIMFKQLAILTSFTLIVSLFTSLMLTPMLASKLLKPMKERRKPGPIFRFSEKLFEVMENQYSKLLGFAINSKTLIIFLVIVLFGVTLFIATKTSSDYLPEFDAGDITVIAEIEQGDKAEVTRKVAEKIENIVYEEIVNLGSKEDIRSLMSVSGQTEKGTLSLMGFSEGKNITTVMAKLVLPDSRNYTSEEVAEKINERVKDIPEIVKFSVTGGSLLGAVLQGNKKPIELKIFGNDIEKLNKTAKELEEKFNKSEYLANVETTIDEGKEELKIVIDKEKAGAMGLNSAAIALAVRSSIYGVNAGDFKEENEEYEINIRFSEEYRNNIDVLNSIVFTTMNGKHVSLSSVAKIEEDRGFLEIKRESQQRVIYVKVNLASKVSLGEGIENIREMLKEVEIPEGVDLEIGGQFEEQQKSFGDLKILFVIGVLLVFMVMASQFESFKDPFLIMFAVPLSIIGVIWSFYLTGTTLSVVTFIGIIMLLGIVVNNGIVLVDYTNLLRARGKTIKDAVIMGGHSRLRPVLMTTFTTLFAMIPMAYSSGMGSEMWSPIGITVIGGLFVSTLITLIFIPVLYVVFNRKQYKKESLS
ncbi:MAG: acriflavine resistance protein B [Candidatus Cloacimonadota bacterium]|nr:MAG: acriflavine resistance protein B [Candidatus Cloacimonadota bacterium]PIE77451.1 MAG: acriflavine resistance protein B [Candidatus Delongbacteria bacterium]